MKDWYFTWGFGHKYPNCYTIITAESYGEARRLMVDKFGNEWAFQYESAEDAGVELFNLKLIK